MTSNILTKQKKYGWRIKLLFFLVILISSGIAYFAQKKLLVSEIDAKESVQQIKKESEPLVQEAQENEAKKTDDLAPIVAAVPTDQEEKVNKEAEVLGDANKEENTAGENDTALKLTATPLTSSERNKNPATRLQEAMIYAQPQILTGKYIDVSLTYQNIVIFQDGKPLKAFLISSGIKGLYTPIGTFKIENKHPRAWSKKYGLWMPYWMAFLPSGEMGIHELPEWPGGYKEGANHLGTPASHGCIRLGIGSAKEIYDWAEIGTPVVIHK